MYKVGGGNSEIYCTASTSGSPLLNNGLLTLLWDSHIELHGRKTQVIENRRYRMGKHFMKGYWKAGSLWNDRLLRNIMNGSYFAPCNYFCTSWKVANIFVY